jgi:DNA-directed RNA polymerase III subunit RPC1
MNVTLGVPRLKEIINAAKLISTPIITAKLESDDNKIAARIVKAGIEKTTLGEVSLSIREVFATNSCYISITLDMEAIELLKLDVDASSVRISILAGRMAQGGGRTAARSALINQLEPLDVRIRRGAKDKLRVYVPANTKGAGKYFAMQQLKAALPHVIVQGIPSIERAVISESDRGETKYNLLMEGYGLLDVMGCPGIDGLKTYTNHVLEIEQVLGVEAARTQISAEIEHIMNAYGIGIDTRHLLLLADVMTFKGEILGITRFGVSKMRESVLMLASFEKTTDHLFDAAVHGRTDAIVGVSECIIMGMEVPVGTGLPSLFWKSGL